LSELDEQAQGIHIYIYYYVASGSYIHLSGYSNDLLPIIRKYIKLRQTLAARPDSEQLEEAVAALPDAEKPTKYEPTPIPNLLNGNGSTPSRPASPTKDQGTPVIPVNTPLVASFPTTRTPTPMSIPPNRTKPPKNYTRDAFSYRVAL